MKILNRIVTVLLCAAVFPALIFRILVRAVVSLSQDTSVYKILSSFSDTVSRKMEITVSIKELVGYIQNGTINIGGMDFDFKKIPAELMITKNWLIAAGVLIVVTLLIALIIMGCGIFTKAHKTVMGLSAGAIACLIAALKCFDRFAAPFVDGTIDLGALIAKNFLDSDNLIGTIGGAALKGAIKVDILQLGNAVFTMGMIFGILLLWTLAYYITLPETDKKQKKIKNK